MNIKFYLPKDDASVLPDHISRLLRENWVEVVHNNPEDIFLIFNEDKLSVAPKQWPKVKPICVDFLSNASSHRRLHGGGAGQAVAKAIGLNKRKDLKVVDATAGLGRDAFVLASLGAKVLMCERHPIVHQLLADGLIRLKHQQTEVLEAGSISLELGNFYESEAVARFAPEVIYLDPMFPTREKSAKVKKDMALFHDLVGSDEDADALLAPALEMAEYRVVVKRPKQAPFLADQKPTTSLVGKSSRFDLYTKKSIV